METKLQELEQRMKHEKSRRMFERYQAIRLYLTGSSNHEIAAIIGRTIETVKTYIRSYEEQGLDGLATHFTGGPHEKLSDEQKNQLRQVIIESLPHEVGFTAKHNWTLKLIAKLHQARVRSRLLTQGIVCIDETYGS
jgi:transposase